MDENKKEQDGGILRVSKNFKEMVNQIKEKEEQRGNINCSNVIATEILYKRIMKAGGLKE